jgi:protein Mpv17
MLGSAAAMTVIQSMIFTAIVSGPNYMFQSWLEEQWPAKTASTQKREGVRLSKEDRDIDDAGRLNVVNTAIKFALDQSLSASMNTMLFIGVLGAIKGRSLEYIRHDILTVGENLIGRLGLS